MIVASRFIEKSMSNNDLEECSFLSFLRLILSNNWKNSLYHQSKHFPNTHAYFSFPNSYLNGVKTFVSQHPSDFVLSQVDRVDQFFDNNGLENVRNNIWYKKSKLKTLWNSNWKSTKKRVEVTENLLTLVDEEVIEEQFPKTPFVSLNFSRTTISFNEFTGLCIKLDNIENNDRIIGTLEYPDKESIMKISAYLAENSFYRNFFTKFNVQYSNSKLIHHLENYHYPIYCLIPENYKHINGNKLLSILLEKAVCNLEKSKNEDIDDLKQMEDYPELFLTTLKEKTVQFAARLDEILASKISLNSIVVNDCSISWQDAQISIFIKISSMKENTSFSIISSISQECVLEEEKILCVIFNHQDRILSDVIELDSLTSPFSF